jgi:hypothetical protein
MKLYKKSLILGVMIGGMALAGQANAQAGMCKETSTPVTDIEYGSGTSQTPAKPYSAQCQRLKNQANALGGDCKLTVLSQPYVSGQEPWSRDYLGRMHYRDIITPGTGVCTCSCAGGLPEILPF